MHVDYIWPTTLQVPSRPPKLVYLDLNHWISLAKAMSGHRDGAQHADALASFLAASTEGAAVFPLSDAIYFEVCKMTSYRQRRHLREVMEALSRYAVVTSRSVIATHEIEAMLDRFVGPSPTAINTMDYLDWGMARAFGLVGGFRIRTNDGRDVTDESRANWADGPEAFDTLFAQAELNLNRQVLDGPSGPEEEAELRAFGYEPTGTMLIAQRRAEQEIEQVGRFDADPNWRHGRIRDVVAAREVLIEINETLFRGIAERGADIDVLFPSPDDARRAFDAMPSLDVAVTLKASYHRDPMHRWTTNDTTDIDALGSTLPYCDVVVTDKAVANHAKRTGLAERLDTVILSRLSGVPDSLR